MARKNEWVEAEKEKPKQKKWFNLCSLDLGDDKIVKGWWTGTKWDGLRYRGQAVKRWMYSCE